MAGSYLPEGVKGKNHAAVCISWTPEKFSHNTQTYGRVNNSSMGPIFREIRGRVVMYRQDNGTITNCDFGPPGSFYYLFDTVKISNNTQVSSFMAGTTPGLDPRVHLRHNRHTNALSFDAHVSSFDQRSIYNVGGSLGGAGGVGYMGIKMENILIRE